MLFGEDTYRFAVGRNAPNSGCGFFGVSDVSSISTTKPLAFNVPYVSPASYHYFSLKSKPHRNL